MSFMHLQEVYNFKMLPCHIPRFKAHFLPACGQLIFRNLFSLRSFPYESYIHDSPFLQFTIKFKNAASLIFLNPIVLQVVIGWN